MRLDSMVFLKSSEIREKKGLLRALGGDQYIIWLDRFYLNSHGSRVINFYVSPVVILISFFMIFFLRRISSVDLSVG